LAVVLLIGITSAGIYGYLSQAFEQSLSQVQGYEKEITSLQRQQTDYDRRIAAYQLSGKKGSTLREEKQAEERARLENYIAERRKDIEQAESSKSKLADETDQMIVGERQRREDEKKRLQEVITERRKDISSLEEDKSEYKTEIDERLDREREREKEVSERISQLDAAVKTYQDQGAGGFLKEDGLKKAAELLKTQGPEREALRKRMDGIQAAKDKAREDLQNRYESLDQRIVLIQTEISDANNRITSLTTGGAEQADNVKTALQNLQEARSSVDSRIATLESEIAEASRKITALSETSSAFGPDSSAEIEEMKGGLQSKKDQAEARILELEGKIRATDIGSFKFVARAFDAEVQAAEATENPVLIKEALDRAVNRVVKWFILILVIVFDPLAVTLVIAYNASLLKIKNGDQPDLLAEEDEENKEKLSGGGLRMANLPIFLLFAGLIIYGLYYLEKKNDPVIEHKAKKASLIGELSARRVDDRAFAYIPEKSFGVISFSGMRMVDEIGLTKVFSDDFVDRIPFIGSLAWDPEACGIHSQGRALYFLQFPGDEYRESRAGDILFGLALPIADENKLKEFIIRQLDLKDSNPAWRVAEVKSPDFLSIRHRDSHISVGMDKNCLVFLTSWWADQADPSFLDKELQEVFMFGQEGGGMHANLSSKLSGGDYDLALALFVEKFFTHFEKDSNEQELWENFQDFLSLDLVLKGEATADGVSLTGRYDYKEGVLNSDYGLRVAAKLDRVRESDFSDSLNGVYGEFAEIFLQRFDFQTVSGTLQRIDLAKSRGFDAFDSIDVGRRQRGDSQGSFSMDIKSNETGDKSLRLLVDLLVQALNPLSPGVVEK
jgi:predicted  nucleic acid-binding Zn-ribbon protein